MGHDDIWTGLDRLAARHGLTPSGLARRAGLDATAFNPSKRAGRDGRPRWPSTESVARALDAVGADFSDLAALMSLGLGAATMVGVAHAGPVVDAATPVSAFDWTPIQLPADASNTVVAYEIRGPSMEPAYREGDKVVVSFDEPLRLGDRVVAQLRSGDCMAKILEAETEDSVDLASLNPAILPIRLQKNDLLWIGRIVWASQ
ncbi:MAG: helix-turn-helix transcriptional regulator [Pseudomonadota bacterium]